MVVVTRSGIVDDAQTKETLCLVDDCVVFAVVVVLFWFCRARSEANLRQSSFF